MHKDNCAITYFLTQGLFLGFGIVHLYAFGGKDTYVGAILGFLIGYLIILLYEYIIKQKNEKTFNEICSQNKFLGIILKIILYILSAIILIYVMEIYKLFVSSFLLINSPPLFIIAPFLIICLYISFKGITIIHRISNCLLPLSVFLFLLSIFSLFSYFSIEHFLPLFTTSPQNIFKTAFTFAGISVFPNILTFHLNSNIKNYSKMYLLGAIPIVATIIIINGVFGETLIHVFRFPEYMVLKQLKIFDFIEKVENIISITWIFAIFNTATMAIYSIKETLPKKKNKLTTCLTLLLITFIIIKILSFDYTYTLKLYNILPYLSIISVLIIGLLMLLLVKKNHHHLQYNKHHQK